MTKPLKKTDQAATRSSIGKRRRAPSPAPDARSERTLEAPIANPQKQASKRNQLAALLVRDQGATVPQMQELTGWLPHTVRAALTGLKKLGYAIDSDKPDGVRTYRAVPPE